MPVIDVAAVVVLLRVLRQLASRFQRGGFAPLSKTYSGLFGQFPPKG